MTDDEIVDKVLSHFNEENVFFADAYEAASRNYSEIFDDEYTSGIIRKQMLLYELIDFDETISANGRLIQRSGGWLKKIRRRTLKKHVLFIAAVISIPAFIIVCISTYKDVNTNYTKTSKELIQVQKDAKLHIHSRDSIQTYAEESDTLSQKKIEQKEIIDSLNKH